MSYQENLENGFVGKHVTANLVERSENNTDFDWESFSEDSNEGEGTVRLDYRPYWRGENNGESEEDDEKSNWYVQIGLDFSVDAAGMIEHIEITAEIYADGDSGLGDCDPEEQWYEDDLENARVFLWGITH